MDNLNQYILQRLDKISEDVGEIKQSQARTETDVRHHIKRTDLLEELVTKVKQQVDMLWAPINLIGRVLRWLKLLR